MEELVRVNKLLSQYGFCSRRQADRYLEEGKVTYEGKVLHMGDKVLPGSILKVEGRTVQPEKQQVILAFYKPRGIECTANEAVKDNVISYLNYDKRLLYVGRLDKDSEGLLLLTNEGDLINKIMRAGNFHEKEYVVEVDQRITKTFISQMSSGVPILDQVTRECEVEQISEYVFRIVLTQGLNRQIRRMCEALGYQVRSLKRIRVMNISLGSLRVGEYRELTQEEEQKLRLAIKDSYNTYQMEEE